MAGTTPPNNPNNPQNAGDLSDIQSALFNSTELFKQMNKQAGIYTFETRAAISRTTELNKLIEQTRDIVTDIGEVYIKQSKVNNVTLKLKREIKKLEDEQRKLLSGRTKIEDAQLKQLEKSKDVQKKLTDQIAIASFKELEAKRKEEEANKNLFAFRQSGEKNLVKQTRLESLAEGRARKLVELQRQRVGLEERLTNEQEAYQKISKGSFVSAKQLTDQQLAAAKSTLSILQSQAHAITEGNLKVRKGDFFKELARRIPGISAFSDLSTHASKFGVVLAGVLILVTGIVSAIKELLLAAFKVDNQITGIAKSLGISKRAAKLLRQEFENVSEASGLVNKNLNNIFLSASNQVEAMAQLNDAFGTAAMFSDQTLQDQIYLTKQLGLQVEQAAQLQRLASIYGESTDKVTTDILQQVVNLQKETGIRVQGVKVLQQVARIEGQLAAQYKNNPKLIAEAVLQAQRFGLTLEQAKSSADSLLSFENSIDSQLEAQLLTDKQLNFERARELALLGDSAGAASELLSQVGSIYDFQKLNVIQQESLAKAIGMSADELANSLRNQQLLRNVTVETKKQYDEILKRFHGTSQEATVLKQLQAATNADELKANISNLSIQSKFEEGLNRIKDIFASIFTKDFLSGLQALVTGFANHLPQIISAVQGLYKIVSFVTDPLHLHRNFAAAAEQVQDSVINPQGNVIVSTPRGNIVPDKNDYIITTTNPGKLAGGDSSEAISALSGKLDKLIEVIEKGGNVYMDSKKMGTIQGMAYSSYK